MATSIPSEYVVPQPPTSPSLLSFSGELRNQIYSYCTQPLEPYNISETWAPYKIPRLSYRPSTTQPGVFFEKCPFFGLTQTNRLLRSEFRPLYMRTTRVYVLIQQLPRFLETFFPAVLASSEVLRAAAYCGNIVIGHYFDKPGNSDYTHVLTLRTHAPNISFQITCQYAYRTPQEEHQINLLDEFFSNYMHSLVDFHRWSYEAIAMFEVEYRKMNVPSIARNTKEQVFTVTFKKSARRDWMDGEMRNPRFLARLIKEGHQKGDRVDGPFMGLLFSAHARFNKYDWYVKAVVEE